MVVSRRRKEKINKLKNIFCAKPKTKKPIQEIKKEFLTNEARVESAKFSPSLASSAPVFFPQDLPAGYGRDKIVLQVRDFRWIHAYWEITPETLRRLRRRLADAFFSAKRVIRVYDISFIIFDGTNAHRFFDIEIGEEANNWYIDTDSPGRSWCVEIGLRLARGEFIKIARSNTVDTPLEGPSWIIDEEWMVPEYMFARLYGMGFGLGRSSPIGKAWRERIKKALFSGVFASGRITSGTNLLKKKT